MNIKFDHDAEWVTGGLRLAPVHRTLKTRGLSTEGGALVVNLEQGVTMAAKWKFLAAGSAAVVAIGGAGLYAGALSVSSSGLSGAGSVALQASCATAATVTPGAATWNATVQKFTYTTVSVAYTEGSTDACSGQKLKVNVYATSGGAELSTGTAVTITDGSNGAAGTAFTLSTAVDAGLATADYKYGVIFQTA